MHISETTKYLVLGKLIGAAIALVAFILVFTFWKKIEQFCCHHVDRWGYTLKPWRLFMKIKAYRDCAYYDNFDCVKCGKKIKLKK